MPKRKSGNGNNYRPPKNPELLKGTPDDRTIKEQAAKPSEKARQPGEGFVQMLDRRETPKKEDVPQPPKQGQEPKRNSPPNGKNPKESEKEPEKE